MDLKWPISIHMAQVLPVWVTFAELKSDKKNFLKNDMPIISSTKSMTGHSLGATGVQEAIYSIMMLKEKIHCFHQLILMKLCDEAEGIKYLLQKTIEKRY